MKMVCLNASSLRDKGKAVRLLCDLLSFGMDLTAIQDTHAVCEVNGHVLSSDYVIYSAYEDRRPKEGVFLLVKCALGARVDLVHIDAVAVGEVDRGRYCEKYFLLGRCDLCIQRPDGALFFLLSFGDVPGGSGAPSLNGGLDYRPRSQVRGLNGRSNRIAWSRR